MRLLYYNKTRKTDSKPNTTNALKFYWTTDLHTKASVDKDPNATGATNGNNRYFYASMNKFKQMITEANSKPLEAFIITGDMFEDERDFNFFMTEWNEIDASMRKELTIGNHDMVGGASAYDDCVTGFGYDARTEIAGSKFNQSFSLSNGLVSARVLIVDSNFDENGNHAISTTGRFTQAELDWLESEMQNATEEVILLMTHHAPHNYDEAGHFYFDQTSAFSIRDIVDNLKVSQPEKVVHCLAGHFHQTEVKPYTNLGNNFKGYLGEALTLYEESDYMVVNVLPNKELYFDYHRVVYNV